MLQSQLFRTVGKSFYSADLYRYVAREWRGYGLSYLFVLLFLAFLIVALKLSYVIYSVNFQVDYSTVDREWYYSPYPAVEEEIFALMQMVDQLPEITVKNGKLSIDDEVPYTIDHPETHDTFIIIDTSGEYNDFTDTPARLLVTADKVMFREDNNSVETYSLKDVKEFTLNQYTTVELLTKGKKILAWLVMLLWLPLTVLFMWGFHIVQALAYGVAGMGMAAAMRRSLSYQALVRLAVVGMTPALLLSAILLFFDIILPYQGAMLVALGLGYLGFGVWVNDETADTA